MGEPGPVPPSLAPLIILCQLSHNHASLPPDKELHYNTGLEYCSDNGHDNKLWWWYNTIQKGLLQKDRPLHISRWYICVWVRGSYLMSCALIHSTFGSVPVPKIIINILNYFLIISFHLFHIISFSNVIFQFDPIKNNTSESVQVSMPMNFPVN